MSDTPAAAPAAAPAAGTLSTSGGAGGTPPAAGAAAPAAPVAPPAAAPAASAPPAPAAGADWRAGISKEFKDHASLKDFKDVDSLAKSYVHAQSMIGADKIVLPKEDDPKLWDPVFDKLGRPKTAAEYKLPEVKLPEGVVINGDRRDAYMKHMHEMGLTQKQASGLYGHFMEDQAKQFESLAGRRTEETNAGIESLKTEWGDKFTEQVNHAVLAVKKFGSDEARALLDSTGLGNHPALVRMFANVGAGLGEDRAGGDGAGDFTTGQEQAVNTIKDIKENKDDWKALNDRADPRHKAILSKWTEAHQKAYPGKQKD